MPAPSNSTAWIVAALARMCAGYSRKCPQDGSSGRQRDDCNEPEQRWPWDESCDREDDEQKEGREHHRLVQPDGPLEADPRGDRAFPAPGVRLVLRHLVHQEERGDE